MAPVLETAKHVLDAAAASISALVVFDGLGAGFSSRNAGRYALCLEGVAVLVRIIPAIREHPLRLGQIVEQHCSAGLINDLTSAIAAERATVSISDCVQLGVHTAFGAANEPLEGPFYPLAPCRAMRLVQAQRSQEVVKRPTSVKTVKWEQIDRSYARVVARCILPDRRDRSCAIVVAGDGLQNTPRAVV